MAGGAVFIYHGGASAQEGATTLPDISSVPPDLVVPPVSTLPPGPGKRVRRTLPGYEHTDVHHTLYLPLDWQPGKKYPMLVEYPGNGPYRSPYGDYSSGDVEDCNLGYGISGGQGFVWMTLPFIDPTHKKNQLWWWGDVGATLEPLQVQRPAYAESIWCTAKRAKADDALSVDGAAPGMRTGKRPHGVDELGKRPFPSR